jgi:CHAT domain-containing protein/tetratricopeptide (TPR) repeat protein
VCFFLVALLNPFSIPKTGVLARRDFKQTGSAASAGKKPVATRLNLSHAKSDGNDLVVEAGRLRSEWRAESTRLAIEKHRSANRLFRRAGERAKEAQSLLGEADALALLGELDLALASYRRALGLASKLRDARIEVDALNGLTEIEIERGDRNQSDHGRRSLELAEKSDYARGRAGALVNIGIMESRRAPDAAIEKFRLAFDLYAEAKDKAGQAGALTNIGLTYGDSGKVSAAQEAFDRALECAIAAGHRPKETRVHLGRALVLMANADWEHALHLIQKAADQARATGDRIALGLSLNGIGSIYEELGEVSQSLSNFNKARLLWRQLGDRAREARILRHIAAVYADSGREAEALRICEKVLRVARVLRETKMEVYVLADAGQIYETQGKLGNARDCYRRAVALARSLHHPRAQAYALARLGRLDLRIGKVADAWENQQAALSLMRQAGDKTGEGLVRYDLARLKQHRGDIEGALADITRIITESDGRRAELVSGDLRTAYFASTYRNYELLIDLRMQKHALEPAKGYDAAAFEASELGRSRTLKDMLSQARADLKQGAPKQLVERHLELSSKLQKKAGDELRLLEQRFELAHSKPKKPKAAIEQNQNALAGNSRALDTVKSEIADLESQLDLIAADIDSGQPEKYGNLLRSAPVPVDELQRQLLDDDTLAIEYSLGEERSYLWGIGKNAFFSRVLPPGDEIERQANRFYKLLTKLEAAGSFDVSPRSPAELAELGAARDRLSRTLLSPVQDLLGMKRLVIVADGALHYIPFQALIEPGHNQPLVMRHEVVSLPSLSVLAQLRIEAGGRPAPSMTLAVLADPVVEPDDPRFFSEQRGAVSPARSAVRNRGRAARRRLSFTGNALDADEGLNFTRLMHSGDEADDIAALVPPENRLVAKGFDATRRLAIDDSLNRFRIVHFATHGLLDFRRPKLSCLLLSRFDRDRQPQDGYLRLHDIYNMKLAADLVVLSACQTALGKDIRGEGLVGLTRGFFFAGAARVVASLWNVDDYGSSKLMEIFYNKMLGPERLAPAAALRAAQIEMIEKKRWSDPYFWAGFVLQGEFK